MDPPADIVVICSTVPAAGLEKIAHALVEQGLVACVNAMPVRSFYRWKGEFCDDSEHLLIMKTAKEKAGQVIFALKGMHPYELPEIIVLPVIAGHLPYLDWVLRETRPA
jgi:periplasmic divalent cation tolerance protein